MSTDVITINQKTRRFGMITDETTIYQKIRRFGILPMRQLSTRKTNELV